LRKILLGLMSLVFAMSLVACGGENNAQSVPTTAPTTAPTVESVPVQSQPTKNTAGQAEHIAVQHILIGFKDAVGFQGRQVPGKAGTRTQEDARKLAYELLDRVKAGEDFEKLMKEHSDDTGPGTYGMSNIGIQPAGREIAREGMVPAFGDVGFGLKEGEIGMADYDPQSSPFGYHIIKRIPPPPPPTKPAGQDDHITVQHILIGFKDAVGFQGQGAPGKAGTRTQEDARKLAYELLDRVKAGEDFEKLMKEHSDDTGPGTYGMANTGVQPATGEADREGMVAAFGNVGFGLKVGEVGMADYDQQTSPFGYHIIKRIK